MVVEHCPCCGQIIPPKLVFYNKPVKQKIYDYIARHPEGVSRDQIFDAVYGDDHNGGPLSSSVVSVHILKMRPALTAAGLRIRSPRGPGVSLYRLEKA